MNKRKIWGRLLTIVMSLAILFSVLPVESVLGDAGDYSKVGTIFMENGLRYKVTSAYTPEPRRWGTVQLLGMDPAYKKKYVDISLTIDSQVEHRVGESTWEHFDVTSIKSGAFKNNKKITFVDILNGVRSIPANCFKGCSNLQSVNVGWIAYTIDSNSRFKETTSITIGKGAFSGCKKLRKISFMKVRKAIIKTRAFKNVKDITIDFQSNNVPKGTKKVLKTIAKRIKKGGAKKSSYWYRSKYYSV